MEPAVAGILYGVETLAEGALVAAKAIYNPTLPLKAHFTRIRAPAIPRSSHTISLVNNAVYIFGGEISPRKPVDNAMHVVLLPVTSASAADYQAIPAQAALGQGEVPTARVGHTAAAIDSQIYVFGGRGGAEMKALEEKGRVWAFNTTTKRWTALDPTDSKAPYPDARSYHASVATDAPASPRAAPNGTATIAEPAQPNTYGTLIIHAGCLSSGGRTCDVWAFDIASRTWTALPAAPGPGRGGTALAMVRNRLYRYGGFDGKTELGGQVDFLDLARVPFDDEGGRGEMALTPAGPWLSSVFAATAAGDAAKAGTVEEAAAVGGPGNRSVAGMVPVTTGQGREYLLILCGEGTPSGGGHETAGRFLDDVWAFQIKAEEMSGASIKDAARQAIKKDTGEARSAEIKYYNEDGVMIQEGQDKPMGKRGWFACDSGSVDSVGASVVLWGGVNEMNDRLGDGWIVTVE